MTGAELWTDLLLIFVSVAIVALGVATMPRKG